MQANRRAVASIAKSPAAKLPRRAPRSVAKAVVNKPKIYARLPAARVIDREDLARVESNLARKRQRTACTSTSRD